MTEDFKIKMQCCGCGACLNICPQNCIKMEPDDEGFVYPSVDKDICTQCGLCDRVCPIKNPVKEEYFAQEAYFVQNRNDEVLRASTSGGFFSVLAEYVISQGGIVYGAVMDELLQVKHVGICDINQLCLFRKSKYVQSNTKNTYGEAKKELDMGRLVCYSGTPCQIEGLKKYLGIKYKNLITCDVVCRSVPSPFILSKYIEFIEKMKGDHVAQLVFRDKSVYGYKYNVITAFNDESKKIYQCGVESDPYLRSFFSDVNVRPSCYNCVFKKQYRISDFTIWDAFNVGRFSKELDNDMGTTRLLIHTANGREIFNQIREKFNIYQVLPEEITDNVREMYESVEYNAKRELFFLDAGNLTGMELFHKYYPDSICIRLERACRLISYKLGIYSFMKRIFAKLLRRY